MSTNQHCEDCKKQMYSVKAIYNININKALHEYLSVYVRARKCPSCHKQIISEGVQKRLDDFAVFYKMQNLLTKKV